MIPVFPDGGVMEFWKISTGRDAGWVDRRLVHLNSVLESSRGKQNKLQGLKLP